MKGRRPTKGWEKKTCARQNSRQDLANHKASRLNKKTGKAFPRKGKKGEGKGKGKGEEQVTAMVFQMKNPRAWERNKGIKRNPRDGARERKREKREEKFV